MTDLPIILHISGDFPDCYSVEKTAAIANLVEGTQGYRHVVYSINRKSALGGIESQDFGQDRTGVLYGALPKGVLWGRRLPKVGAWIAEDLQRKNIRPQIVHAHKLTIEGVVGKVVADAFSCPLLCNIQGHTDVKILNAKKSMRKAYESVVQQSAAIFPFSPWSYEAVSKIMPLDVEKCALLPVVPHWDEMSVAPVIEDRALVSVFHLDGWKNKNFEGMVDAIKLLSSLHTNIRLDVYGDGTFESAARLNTIIQRQKMGNHIRLMGEAKNESLPQILKKYAGLVLPSFSESYGLVYAEALMCGLPVLFNKECGIAGYFDPEDVGYAADVVDIQDIANGMMHLIDHQKLLKENIAQMQQDGRFDFMRRDVIIGMYQRVLEQTLGATHGA